MANKKYQPHFVIQEKTESSAAKFLRILTEDDLPFGGEIDPDIYALLQALNDEVL
jgi:hypothetical protein